MSIILSISTLIAITLIVYWTCVAVSSMFKEEPLHSGRSCSWNSYIHDVVGEEGKYVVEDAFKTKRSKYAMRLKNIQTGSTKTVYGLSVYDVSRKAERIFEEWRNSEN